MSSLAASRREVGREPVRDKGEAGEGGGCVTRFSRKGQRHHFYRSNEFHIGAARGSIRHCLRYRGPTSFYLFESSAAGHLAGSFIEPKERQGAALFLAYEADAEAKITHERGGL